MPARTGGVVPVAELLMVSYGARQHIRKNALQHLNQEITITRKAGSFSLEESLARFVRNGVARARRCATPRRASRRARISSVRTAGSTLMQIGFIGLGRMGGNMTRRLTAAGHTVVAWDRNPDAVRSAPTQGDRWRGVGGRPGQRSSRSRAPSGSWSRPALPPRKPSTRSQRVWRRATWSSTAATPTSKTTCGGRERSRRKGIDYVDVGTSGGVWGAERGYCLMIGGSPNVVERLTPLFKSLAPGRSRVAVDADPNAPASPSTAPEGYLHCGPAGAGHFVKMIHNGIEYGLMQSYAEGFDILRNADSPSLPADQRYTLDLADIAEVWRRGSVVSSWLLDLAALALARGSAARGVRRAPSATPARDAGPSRRPSKKTCPPTC